MLKETSEIFKKFILLRFTEELIRHVGPGEIFKLEEVIKAKEKAREEIIKERLAKENVQKEIHKERER